MTQTFALIATALLFVQIRADCTEPVKDCKNKVECLVAPCSVATCPAHPEATCVDNFCGGCCAWFYVKGKRVDCELPPADDCLPPTPDCPVRAPCSPRLCENMTCPAYPKATCKVNNCGGCCTWFYRNGKRVNCDDKPKPPPKGCTRPKLDCPNMVHCLVPPCKYATCPAYPDAKCEDNYCGGCCPWFTVKGRRVNCRKRVKGPRPCTSPKPFCRNKHYCFVEPCLSAICPAYPDAVCYNNYCGGCCPWFYVDGKVVDCGETRKPKCPKVDPDTGGICVEACSSDDECKEGDLCCSNGCGHVCMTPV